MGTLSSAPPDTELCIFVLVDGARPDVMSQLIASGHLPNMGRYLDMEGSTSTAVTCLPSTTSLAYLPMLTGQYPGTADVPGTRWVEKDNFGRLRPFHSGHRSYAGPGMSRFSRDLADSTETIFELCADSLAFRSEVQRGLSPRQNRYWVLCGLPYTIGHYIRRTDFMDRWAVRGLCKELRGWKRGGPGFVFLPLSDVDTRSHGHGPMSQQVAAAYRAIDQGIGAIVETLREIGLWSRTHLIISSDHGNTFTASHLDLSRLVGEAGYRVFEYPMVLRRNCTAAVMVSGNALAHIYLSGEGGWQGPISGLGLHREHGSLLEKLKGRDEVEWVAYREDDGRIAVATAQGAALVGTANGSYTYHWEGRDPLQLGLQDSTIPRQRQLAETIDTPFPDALEQLCHLFRSSRTGDIVVTAKPGYDLRARYEWPEHHSSHGGLCRDQMLVPLLSNRPLDGSSPVRTVDIFATIAGSLGLQPGKPHFGRNLL